MSSPDSSEASRDTDASSYLSPPKATAPRRRAVIIPPPIVPERYIGPFERERFLNLFIPFVAIAVGLWLAWMGPWLIDPY